MLAQMYRDAQRLIAGTMPHAAVTVPFLVGGDLCLSLDEYPVGTFAP